MNLMTALWHLQLVDQEIDEKTKRARQVEDALANDPSVASSHAALDAEQKQLGELSGILRDRELEGKSLDAKIKELNERLYSGRVTNPKELDGLQKDSLMQQHQRSALDDKLLELMDSVEQAKARADEKAKTLKHIEAKRAGDVEQLVRERDTLAARLAELNSDRERTRAAINADTLRTYDRLRQIKAGRAIVQLRHDACGSCGVSVPTGLINRVHAADEIVVCPSCGRILAP